MGIKKANDLMRNGALVEARNLYAELIRRGISTENAKFNLSLIDGKLNSSTPPTDCPDIHRMKERMSEIITKFDQGNRLSSPVEDSVNLGSLSRSETLSRLRNLIRRGQFYKAGEVIQHEVFRADPLLSFLGNQFSERYSRRNWGLGNVLVIIPAFNADKTIEQSISSVLSQTYRNLRILVVDDSSTDSTYAVVKRIQSQNIAVDIVTLPENSGTYGAVNFGLLSAHYFDFFLIHGADDWMYPSKVSDQLLEMDRNQHVASYCAYARISADFTRTLKASMGDSMGLFPSRIFYEFGFFDDTRFGGDSEYKNRIQVRYGRAKISFLNKVLTLAFFNSGNLTSSNPENSKKRADYIEKFKTQHEAMRLRRDFFVEPNLVTLNKRVHVYCGLATIIGREKSLSQAVNSLLPQVDHLFVYQNGYKKAMDFLESSKVTVISSLDTGIDMGDAGKFYKVGDLGDCYYFSADDDLIYPENYVSTLLSALRVFGDRIFVSAHGRVLHPDAKSYYKDAKHLYQCLKTVPENKFVQFGGTGVMAFRTSMVNLKFDLFKLPNMADVWVGLYAHENRIPIQVVAHDAGWIRYSENFDRNETIYEKHSQRDGDQNKLISKLDLTVVHTI